jgi:hypothetical protein
MARTAVVAGTATAVSGRVQRRQAGREQAAYEPEANEAEMAAMQAQLAELQAQQAAAPPPAAAPAGDDLATKLQGLADLHASGVLSDEEFAAAKARLIGG